MEHQWIAGLVVAMAVTVANAHVVGTIVDGSERITLTDNRTCKDCDFDATTTATGMNVTWNYSDIDGILNISESDGVSPADIRKYTVDKEVRLTAFGKKMIGPAND